MFEKGSSLNLTLSSCFWGFLDENIDKVLLSEINQNWFSSSGGGAVLGSPQWGMFGLGCGARGFLGLLCKESLTAKCSTSLRKNAWGFQPHKVGSGQVGPQPDLDPKPNLCWEHHFRDLVQVQVF